MRRNDANVAKQISTLRARSLNWKKNSPEERANGPGVVSCCSSVSCRTHRPWSQGILRSARRLRHELKDLLSLHAPHLSRTRLLRIESWRTHSPTSGWSSSWSPPTVGCSLEHTEHPSKHKTPPPSGGVLCIFVLRGPDSNRRLGVMSPPRYHSSTPRCGLKKADRSATTIQVYPLGRNESNDPQILKYLLKVSERTACFLVRELQIRLMRDTVPQLVRLPRKIDGR